jgi:hypothetical protein
VEEPGLAQVAGDLARRAPWQTAHARAALIQPRRVGAPRRRSAPTAALRRIEVAEPALEHA